MQSKLWQNIRNGFSIAGTAVLLLAASATNADAQLWQTTHHSSGADVGRSTLLLPDNLIVTAGENASGTPSADVYVFKTDACDNITWSFLYDLGGRDQVGRIRATADEGYIVVGTTQNTNSEGCGTRDDIFLMKLSAGGAVDWTRVYGGCNLEEGRDVRVVADGYIVAGSTTSNGAGGQDAYLMKVDLNGNPIWGRTYGGAGTDFFTSCNIAPNNDIVAVGETFSYTSPTNGDIFVTRVTQSTGLPTPGFPKRYGGNDNDLAWSVLVESWGDIIIAGGTKSYGSSYSEGFLLKLNSGGIPITMRTIGGQTLGYWDELLDLTKYNSYYLVTGLFDNVPGGWGGVDMFVGLFDGSFNAVSTMLHGGTGNDQGWGVATNSAVSGTKNIVVTGLTTSHGVTSQDIYQVRQNNLGQSGGCADRVPTLRYEYITPSYTTISTPTTSTASWCSRLITPRSHQDARNVLCTDCPTFRNTEMPDNLSGAPAETTVDDAGLKLYPNPVNGQHAFVLEHTPITGAMMNVTVTDMAGKQIAQGEHSAANGRMELSTEGWDAGTYLVQVKIGQRTLTRQITVLEN